MISKIQCDKDCGVLNAYASSHLSYISSGLMSTNLKMCQAAVCPSTPLHHHRKHCCHILGLAVVSLLTSSLGLDSPTFLYLSSFFFKIEYGFLSISLFT